MTVSELLKRIAAAYPAFDAKASETWPAVFRARLTRFEGDLLDAAAIEVLGTFRPKYDQKFPIPLDFEQHLPSLKKLPHDDSPALDMAGRKRRAAELVADWQQRQKPKIIQARGPIIANQCQWEVERIANTRGWARDPKPILLTVDQIQANEDRVVSSERNLTHGPIALRSKDSALWQQQTEQVRAEVRAGRRPSQEAFRADDEPRGRSREQVAAAIEWARRAA